MRLYYAEEQWQHGLRCAECDRRFVEGDEYRQRPEAMCEDGTPVLLIVCAHCEEGL